MKFRIVSLVLVTAFMLALGSAFAGGGHGGEGKGHEKEWISEETGNGYGHIKHDVSPS
jgi:hypothetical protein